MDHHRHQNSRLALSYIPDGLAKRAMRISDQIAAVQQMNKSQLLDYVLANPHYLIDPFYKDLAEAIKHRRNQLDGPPQFTRRLSGR